jgi:branched-chain amino acid transport system permease protein
MTLRGTKSNEQRMKSIGFPVFRYRLVAFVIAGAICGLAGVLSSNQTDFVSPAVMHWTRSGDLIIMTVLGGIGTLFGPVIGAVAFLILEELLSGITEYWQLFFGPMLVLIVIFARGGIDGMLVALNRLWLKFSLKKNTKGD